MGARVSGWVARKVCPGYISETVRCRKLILGRDIGGGGCRCSVLWCDRDLTLELTMVSLTFKILCGQYLRNHKV